MVLFQEGDLDLEDGYDPCEGGRKDQAPGSQGGELLLLLLLLVLPSAQISEGCQLALEKVPGEPQVYIPNSGNGSEKAFTYDYAFPGASSNSDLYKESVEHMVSRAVAPPAFPVATASPVAPALSHPQVGKLFEGYNVTVLAYGQTGSGKTHSMGTAYKAETNQVGL